jgi:hypothetical protein
MGGEEVAPWNRTMAAVSVVVVVFFPPESGRGGGRNNREDCGGGGWVRVQVPGPPSRPFVPRALGRRLSSASTITTRGLDDL